jgi:hypothetical protein
MPLGIELARVWLEQCGCTNASIYVIAGRAQVWWPRDRVYALVCMRWWVAMEGQQTVIQSCIGLHISDKLLL